MQQEWEPGTEIRLLIGGAAGLAVLIAIAAVYFLVLRPDPAPVVNPPAPSSAPRLAVETALRSGPGPSVAIVLRLPAETEIVALGRSEDGDWLLVHPAADAATTGWIALAALLDPPPLSSLAIVRPGDGAPTPAATATTATATPTFSPDLPDLVLEDVLSEGNHLVVVLANRGVADVAAAIIVTVEGHDPHRVDVKVGEPLRPGERIRWPVPGEYVQRRAQVSVALTTDPPIAEEQDTNNAIELVLGPDQPNDLALVQASSADGPLIVTVQNNSPIPIVGTLLFVVRESFPGTTLLGREAVAIGFEPGEVREIELGSISDVELTTSTIRLSTDAINDADPSNDVFPR